MMQTTDMIDKRNTTQKHPNLESSVFLGSEGHVFANIGGLVR